MIFKETTYLRIYQFVNQQNQLTHQEIKNYLFTEIFRRGSKIYTSTELLAHD